MRLYHPSFPQCRFAATVSVTFLAAFTLAVSVSDTHTHASDLVVPESQNETLIFSDNSAQIQLALGSHNGLEIRGDDDTDAFGLDVVRRAPAGDSDSLANNEFKSNDIRMGEMQWYYFETAKYRGKSNGTTTLSSLPANVTGSDNSTKQEPSSGGGDNAVYISLTTCQKPDLNTTNTDDTPELPQLSIHVSRSTEKPAPGNDDDHGTSVDGYLNLTWTNDETVYIGVSAPESKDYSGSYSYQIAASTDTYFHRVSHDPNLFFVDADVNSALFTTGNLSLSNRTQDNYNDWMNLKEPPYTIFVNNLNDTAITGLEQSYCALQQNAQIKGNSVETNMTDIGPGNHPKELLYAKGLNESSTYLAILAMDGNSTDSGNRVLGGGGKVWQPRKFTTKADGNCAIIFGLSFCSEVAYAVPSNPSMTKADLQKTYDDYASSIFKNFTYSLQQVQCNASSYNMYSLAVDCDNCSQAYKDWLCSVTIPRCEDYSSSDYFLRVRNAGQDFINGTSLDPDHADRKTSISNRSRNPIIDEQIKPGPYKEILPCQDICHNLVRSCPASLKFSCPQGEQLDSSYGRRNDNTVTCNYMGAAYYMSSARSMHDQLWVVPYALGVFWALSWIQL
ncbi:hypothetical protein SI65_01144 [Aspergillus cristatus]|uniref:Calcium influx-promoting protein ehs1 n=1 Tax=Aspergillus cristatus TaxID=573508 RepID=A0A1E3BRH4_ASPCR|nr:hypothetical protein SI65_01144 [Aspergillus cristatus]